MKQDEFFEVTVITDSCHWKQLLKARDHMRAGFKNGTWLGKEDGTYTVASGVCYALGREASF